MYPSVVLICLFWLAFGLLGFIFQAMQNPVATKSQIADPYQDSRALEFGSKPRATYRPLESAK